MLKSGPGYTEHIHFILNDPRDFDGFAPQSCLTVWATTINRPTGFDQGCILDAGCHEFIGHPSYIPFSMAELYQAADLEKRVAAKVLRTYASVSDAFVRRLIACMVDSPRTSRSFKIIARQLWDSLPPG